mmetsp:Transcript_41655/g.90792  ORF Transcript_41655/g.90792 Transcript_41655/m.90792 type:complete len:165 (-) Transcript_41655:65-559(-)|eukprot:CAMPEP_0170630484 /NCGR_PEP_ID=MMETSP0224-20130122/34027_1 /TAXON_ID=285029 /ORGANISM="Togula jolla, Strain CCCM 725" /LENGTH=164 /DNA_ID=CAMNT_0010958549 /DNA_START=64 /DNA_END=558 /DNA_ORIENTATION=+
MFRIAHALARPAAVTVGGCVGMSLIGPPPQARPLLRCHCQVPCGIFHDDGRIAAILEDAITIRKAVTQAQELHKAGKLQDMHQFVRWVNTKEEHASKIMTTIAEYFLAQKVKKDQLSEHDYHEVLALHHAVMVAAMKAKQSSDMAAVDALDAAIAGLRKIYEAK